MHPAPRHIRVRGFPEGLLEAAREMRSAALDLRAQILDTQRPREIRIDELAYPPLLPPEQTSCFLLSGPHTHPLATTPARPAARDKPAAYARRPGLSLSPKWVGAL